ncbi:MAG: triose-phosphate isomerase [Phycisphaerales bacterium]|nr:triose-phosphate isomerase [Phycisphaerales bacterium]
MRPRMPFVGGNWKMNTDLASAVELAEGVVASCSGFAQQVDIALFPPFVYLQAVGRALGHRAIVLGSQDLWPEPPGAFTGSIGPAMLADLNVRAVIVGHSERRLHQCEDDRLVGRKLRVALESNLTAVLCVGESLEQRESGLALATVERQLGAALASVSEPDPLRLVVAYEPIWAIGTGRTASPADAQEVHGAIRQVLAKRYDAGLSRSVRIIYGGSVNGRNASDLLAQPDVDGGLVGGASLKAEEFTAICAAAARRAVQV